MAMIVDDNKGVYHHETYVIVYNGLHDGKQRLTYVGTWQQCAGS